MSKQSYASVVHTRHQDVHFAYISLKLQEDETYGGRMKHMKHVVRLAEIYNYSHCKLNRNKHHSWKSQENELLVHVSRNKVHTVQMLRLHMLRLQMLCTNVETTYSKPICLVCKQEEE